MPDYFEDPFFTFGTCARGRRLISFNCDNCGQWTISRYSSTIIEENYLCPPCIKKEAGITQ